MRRHIAGLSLLATVFSGALLFSGVGPASATTFTTGGTAVSTTAFTIGNTEYGTPNDGDDIAFNRTSGIAIDMRWQSCFRAGTIGAIKYNLHGESARLIGTNFKAGTCLQLQYRGYSQTGAFKGVTYFGYNIQ